MDVEVGRQGVFVPMALAVNLGLWMMSRGCGLAFGDWVGGLPVTVQNPQKENGVDDVLMAINRSSLGARD